MKAVVALALAGCTVGPDYQKPETKTAGGFSEAEGGAVAAAPIVGTWWSAFGDPTLDSLVARTLQANLDLEQAAARIREARARAGQSRGELMPQLAASGSATRNRMSENGVYPVVGNPQSHYYSAGFDSGWEIDVFGGLRRGVKAADAEVDASVEDRRSVLVSLLGEVARAYVDLRGAQQLSEILGNNIAAAKSTLVLTRTRLQAGLATELDVARAETQLSNTEALLPEAQRTIRISIHRLGVLSGQEPGALAAELEKAGPIPAPPERVLVGLPSELLTRRPDLRRAERRLAAATARIGVATAELYPKFSLTGAFGLESVDVSDFAKSASRAWSLGPTVRWPIFQGGRILNEIEVQDARAQQALVAYRQSILSALEEVENAIVAYLREWDQRRAREAAAASSRKAAELATNLYSRGLTNFLDVLEAERDLYDAERRRVESEAAVTVRLVALYKALGGGWEIERDAQAKN